MHLIANICIKCTSKVNRMFASLFLFFIIIQDLKSEKVNVAGLFEQNPIHAKAFQYAIETVNENQKEDDFSFVPLINNKIQEDDPFSVLNSTCLFLSMGVVALFGPRSFTNINAVQSVCDAKEIPHIITRWNYSALRDSTEINFYPHPSQLSRAYFDTVMTLDWKTFTVLYEDDEGLLRLTEFVRMTKAEGLIVTLQQLDKQKTGNYRTTLKEVRKSQQKFFVVDCQIDHLHGVLLQFQQIGLMNRDYHYFLTNLDAHTQNLAEFQYAEANITGIRIINPERDLVQKISNELYADDESTLLEPAAWKLQTETALLIDAVHMFSTTLNGRSKQSFSSIIKNNNAFQCNETESWEHGYSIVNLLKTNVYEGLTGQIKFDTEGFRSDIELEIFKLKEGGITEIGTWNSSRRLNIRRYDKTEFIPDEETLVNKTFIITITLTDPYGMLKATSERLVGNDRFEGFGIDLIKKLSEMEGFNYTFIVREDKKNGAKNPVTGKWSGMIGDLLDHVADLAITDFTITSDREEAVDFTVPFMNLGISILFKKPSNAPPSFFSFADPFASDTWIALGIAYFIVACSFYVMGRLCVDEWNNPYPCVEEPEYLINQFSFSNSIWFVTGSLMAQGSEIAPIAMPTRMVAGMWWFFCLLIGASYTANLAAFLATENPLELFKDIQSLYENPHGIKYGAKQDGATQRFFLDAEDGIFQKIGQYMRDHLEDMVKENDEGVIRAENELYAFFMESTSIEYTTQRHCDLKQYGGLLDEKGYGIAMRKNSPYRKRLSTAILKLQSSQYLDLLKRKWWEERRGGGQCEGNTEAAEATPLGLMNVEGCFWVTIYGTILSSIFVIIEYLINMCKLSKRTKVSLKDVFKEELKHYLDFNSNTKPVISRKSLDKSKSESKEEQKSNTKTKSRSKSKSPPVSKSIFSKSSQNSESIGTSKSPFTNNIFMSPSNETINEMP